MRISPEHWTSFCATFSHHHRGWLVSVGRATTAALEADANAPWMPMSLEEEPLLGVECCDSGCVITTGEGSPRNLYQVVDPIEIRREETRGADHAALRIVKADGETILLRIHAALQPKPPGPPAAGH